MNLKQDLTPHIEFIPPCKLTTRCPALGSLPLGTSHIEEFPGLVEPAADGLQEPIPGAVGSVGGLSESINPTSTPSPCTDRQCLRVIP